MKRKRKKVVHQKSSSADDALGQNSEENVDAESGDGLSSSDGEFYNVDHIVNGPNKVGKYEVKWEGYDSDQNTWEKAIGYPKKYWMNMQVVPPGRTTLVVAVMTMSP